MTHPKLSNPSSGFGGRGYRDIFRTGGLLPSITTCTGALAKDGLIDWHVEQTALFCITHVDDILNRTEEAGVRYAQYFSRRKSQDIDDPNLNPYNAAQYVLDDLSDTGTYIHQFLEDDLNDFFPEEPVREDHVEMVEAWYDWKSQHDIEVIATESTVFGDGYAGTADLFAKVDGVIYCIDHKSSRKVHRSHVAQLAAIGAAVSRAVEVPEGTEGAVYHKMVPTVAKDHGGQVDSWWVEREMPVFQAYGVLQIRPSDFDRSTGEYIAPFVKLHDISQTRIDAGYKLFRSGLDARIAEREMKIAEKEEA